MKRKKDSKKLLRILHYIFFFLFGVVMLFSLYTYILKQPNNHRDWEVGFETLPSFKIKDNEVTIHNVRDYKYVPDKLVSTNYIDRTVKLSDLERVWFIEEPFEGHLPFNLNGKGIAHTYFIFDFKDQAPIGVSVEARREKGEEFDLVKGLLNRFELMYVWATETDLTLRRALVGRNSLYMYPLTITNSSAQKLFLQLAETSHSLETQPRFYNSLTSNCTNELGKNVNRIKPNTLKYNAAWIFPGYAVAELYRLGFIPHNLPLEDLKNKYYITPFVQQNYTASDFSSILRAYLNK